MDDSLRIVGGHGNLDPDLAHQVVRRHLEDRVIVCPKASDSVLREAYCGATAFIYHGCDLSNAHKKPRFSGPTPSLDR